ncbi:MAG TPA: FIST N-terminal domain-containing protein [Candidatus Margulisiibacteriota bacterium]|nr:FIST N-terminal domain-containing protein [Candidatus Margulisiibacteriota bacterium]
MEISIGVSIEKDPASAAREALKEAIKNLSSDSKISLAIAFSSIDLAGTAILKTIGDSLANTPVIGCSGAAVISNKGIFKHGLALMLLCCPKGTSLNAASASEIKSKSSLEAGRELGEKLLSGFKDTRRDLSIVFSDGLIEDSSGLIHGLEEKLGMSFPTIGCAASDNLNFLRTYLFLNQNLLADSAVGVLLGGGKLHFSMGIRHGWKPLGKPREVTFSKGNLVLEIDGQSAAKIYEEYLARKITELKKELKNFSILYPLGIYLPGEDEYLLRNIISIEHNGALRFQGDVPQGSQVRLMIGTRTSCLIAAKEAAEEAKAGLFNPYLNNRSPKKYFVLLFDSIFRNLLLSREANKELEIIKKVFGQDIPIIGLYTYGEYAPLKALNYRGKIYAHNQGVAMLAIGE